MIMQLTMKDKKVFIDLKIKLGDIIDFSAVNSALEPVKISDFKEKYKLISVVPSLDTSTCALQTATFNKYATDKFKSFEIVTISKDLPFAQTRNCQQLQVSKNFHVWSDYRQEPNSFASVTGLLIKELQLLARAIIVLDNNNKIIYFDIVQEISHEPNYEKLLAFIKTKQIC